MVPCVFVNFITPHYGCLRRCSRPFAYLVTTRHFPALYSATYRNIQAYDLLVRALATVTGRRSLYIATDGRIGPRPEQTK